jgi:transposase-like protein
LEEVFRKRHKRPIGISWRMDETYIKVKGQWVYWYRAVSKEGKTIDFMLSKNRDEPAARALSGIELHHMLRKKQHTQSDNQTIFEQFYGLAA